jgi:hypothetical protein
MAIWYGNHDHNRSRKSAFKTQIYRMQELRKQGIKFKDPRKERKLRNRRRRYLRQQLGCLGVLIIVLLLLIFFA